MADISGKSAKIKSRAKVDPVHQITKTLREHYEEKHACYSIDSPSRFDDDLKKLFPQIPKNLKSVTAASFLTKNRAEFSRCIAQWTGEYRYNINQVLREMIERCRVMNLRVSEKETQLKQNTLIDVDRPYDELSARCPSSRGTVGFSLFAETGFPIPSAVKDNSMKKLRALVLMHESLVPPNSMEGYADEEILEWKTEFDVVNTLKEIGHHVLPLGVYDDLGDLRRAGEDFKPHIWFNLLEEFHGVGVYDQHVVSYLELMKQHYTGCNPRGLLLGTRQTACQENPLFSPDSFSQLFRRAMRQKNKNARQRRISTAGKIRFRRRLARNYQCFHCSG